jgi:hypothetical protein
VISRHVYESFLRYVLRYVVRHNFGEKYEHPMMNLGHVSTISTEYLSYNALTTSEHSGFSWFRKASRNRLKTKMCHKTYLGHVLVLRYLRKYACCCLASIKRTGYEKNHSTIVRVITCNWKQGHYNDRKICKIVISNEIRGNPSGMPKIYPKIRPRI